MKKLQKIYRSNYAGENIITELNLDNHEWDPTVEFIPNQVFNTFSTKHAVAIGNGESRKEFPLWYIERHKGGLLARDRLQSYACNAIFRDFAPDFLIATGDETIQELVESGYTDDHIVYAHADAVLKYPGKFYMIPQNPYYDAGSLSAYLACFDGHKKVFLLGYDQYTENTYVNNVYKDTRGYLAGTEMQNGNFFAMSLYAVVSLYGDVEFVRVMPNSNHRIHESFLPLPNFRQIDYRRFVIEADIG